MLPGMLLNLCQIANALIEPREGRTVSGLVYDVATGKVETIVPPMLFQP